MAEETVTVRDNSTDDNGQRSDMTTDTIYNNHHIKYKNSKYDDDISAVDEEDDDDDDNNSDDTNFKCIGSENVGSVKSRKIPGSLKNFDKTTSSITPTMTNSSTATKNLKVQDQQINESDVTTFLCACNNPENCCSLKIILKSFNAPISEEQAWALIYQIFRLYRDAYIRPDFKLRSLRTPNELDDINVHSDGSVHLGCDLKDTNNCTVTTLKKVLMQVGIVVYKALDYNLQDDEECMISRDLEQLISYMTVEDIDDEGIERDSEYDDEEKSIDTKELDHILELCTPRVQPSVPDDHYKAVCRALVTESLELQVFLQKVFQGDTEALRIKADTQTSKQELDKLGFSDWARFWVQVVDELRRGVRLKKSNFSRTRVEYELTPYEILMEDIRSRKYNLRKVMVNGDIPPRVKKDAHALILEFIRSRPPLKKASERKLPPPIHPRTPSPREQLMDSIRKGRTLKPIQPRLKSILLPVSQVDHIKKEESSQCQQSPRSKQRLIKVDFSLLQDDEWNSPPAGSSSNYPTQSRSSTQMPAYPTASIYNNENNPNNINTVLRRTKDTITHDEYHRFCDHALECK